jgi:peptide/nickel transport system permease protein
VVMDVSFDVHPGEVLGIVGESGCGKSVTAAAIIGSLGSTGHLAGGVFFKSQSVGTEADRDSASIRGNGIGYVSQDPMVSLDPCFRVSSQLGELVRKHDGLHGVAQRRRVIELLTLVGLPDPQDVARRYPHQLSGGMAQRVSIACALAGRPELLVADEPTTALDVTVQGEILDLLRTLQQEQGMSIILVTHDLGVVADLCDRVVVMYAGEVVETADVATLFAHPASPYTRAMLESNPIVAERGKPLRTIAGTVPAPRDWPGGCHFFERCPIRVDACALSAIPLLAVADDHEARCIRAEEVVRNAA